MRLGLHSSGRQSRRPDARQDAREAGLRQRATRRRARSHRPQGRLRRRGVSLGRGHGVDEPLGQQGLDRLVRALREAGVELVRRRAPGANWPIRKLVN